MVPEVSHLSTLSAWPASNTNDHRGTSKESRQMIINMIDFISAAKKKKETTNS